MSKTVGLELLRLELQELSSSAVRCLSLSGEPLIQTTSHSTLHFLGSSAIHPPSVKSIRWMIVEITEGQTDRFLSFIVRIVQCLFGAWPFGTLTNCLAPRSAACSVVKNCSMSACSILENRSSDRLHISHCDALGLHQYTHQMWSRSIKAFSRYVKDSHTHMRTYRQTYSLLCI